MTTFSFLFGLLYITSSVIILVNYVVLVWEYVLVVDSSVYYVFGYKEINK